MKRVSSVDVINGEVPTDQDIWLDHVMNDIPNTMMAAISAAPSNVKAISIYVSNTSADMHCKAVADSKGIHLVWVNTRYERLNPPEGVIK